MGSDFPLFPDQASTIAPHVDALLFFLLGITAFFTILIAAFIIYFCLKYRRRSEAERPKRIIGSIPLEITWTVIPLIVTIILFFWGSSLYFKIARPPDQALQIFVVPKQWMWKFQHADGQREINDLHVPVGRPVRLTMISQDVIHSFFVPAFRVHQDILPGRYSTTWFQATKPGRYHLFCSQYCGSAHSKMIGWVYVMDPAEYEAWLGYHGDESLAHKGQRVFQKWFCINCHSSDAQAYAPSLQGLYGSQVRLSDGSSVTADESYIRESIRDPNAKIVAGFQQPSIMPKFDRDQVSEEEILELIAYLKSLGAQPPTPTSAMPPDGELKKPAVDVIQQSVKELGSEQPVPVERVKPEIPKRPISKP